jgi:hypothetical protein
VGAWLALNALLWLYILVYVALTVLASTLTRSTAAAGGLAFGLLVVLALPGAVPQVAPYLPGWLLNWGQALAAGVEADGWRAFWTSLGLITVALGAAGWLFRRQEL